VPGAFIGGDKAFDAYARQEVTIVPVSSLEEMIEQLESGVGDYFITEYRSGLLGIRVTGDPARIVALDKPVVSIPLVWAISNKSLLLKRKDEIDQLLQQYSADGRLQLLMRQSMQSYLSYLKD